MGASGSGNWYRHDTKPTVEGRLALDVNRVVRMGAIRSGASGTIWWPSQRPGKNIGELGFSTTYSPSTGWLLTLHYRGTHGRNSGHFDLPIQLTMTRAGFGGERFWFVCPLSVNGVPCTRRAGKLYLRGKYFGCRNCHDLRYTSSQEAHKDERMLTREFGRKFDSRAVRALRKRLERGE